MKAKILLAGLAAVGGMVATGVANADTDLIYSFNPGSYFDFSDGPTYSANGTFVYDATKGIVTDVNYYALPGPFDFSSATTVSSGDVIFTGDGEGDGNEYIFLQSLALGGTDNITGGNYWFEGVSEGGVTAGGSVTEIGTAVPEPATWALMMFGLGLIGLGLRTRREATVA